MPAPCWPNRFEMFETEWIGKVSGGDGSQVPIERMPAADGPSPRSPSPRVLVVDDDDAIRSMLAEALGFEGYEVECARDGQEALGYIRRAPPQAIVLDLMMPVMDGGRSCRDAATKPCAQVCRSWSFRRPTTCGTLPLSSALEEPVW